MNQVNLENVNWVDRLIYEYTEGRKSLRVQRDSLKDTELDRLDKGKINSMINEMSEVIKWLKVGKDPNDFKNNDKRSAYQRRVILDMDLFPSLDIMPDSVEEESSGELTEDQKPYTPIFAEIEFIDKGKSDEGFAADYDGVYEVLKVVKTTETTEGDCE